METKAETKKEGDTIHDSQSVTMGMDVFDCPVCYEPLGPPVYQCHVGHFVCSSCRGKLKKCKCPLCPGTVNARCFGMDHVVESVVVPCSYAENGCSKKITYYDKKRHEKECPHGPCFCPDPGCGFAGPAAALLDHFTTQHKWPSTAFKYYDQFGLLVRPGVHVLHAQDGHLFLVNMVLVEPLGHTAVSLVCVRANTSVSRFGCAVIFSCFTGHHQVSTLDAIRCSSLFEGLPKDYFCIVPKASGGGTSVVLRTTIDTESAAKFQISLSKLRH